MKREPDCARNKHKHCTCDSCWSCSECECWIRDEDLGADEEWTLTV